MSVQGSILRWPPRIWAKRTGSLYYYGRGRKRAAVKEATVPGARPLRQHAVPPVGVLAVNGHRTMPRSGSCPDVIQRYNVRSPTRARPAMVALHRPRSRQCAESTPKTSRPSKRRRFTGQVPDRSGPLLRKLPGKNVPLSNSASVDRHRCVAHNDVMASGRDFDTQVITDLSLSALHLGFRAERQGHALPADTWHTCPEPR